MRKLFLTSHFIFLTTLGCLAQTTTKPSASVRLVTLDPGHFHAALVQKSMYSSVDSRVHVYAPAGPDVQLHLDRITAYNTRTADPTRWQEQVYTGPDFFQKMLADKAGNVVVIAGNNQKKTEYIAGALNAGFNVLADKPMVINSKEFKTLETAFATAQQKNLLLYDIMTERFEITTVLQKALSQVPQVFGTLEKGTPDNPAVTKESVHYFYKYVSGSVLTRPPWFMDVRQEGEGIVDVTTHLVDLVQWECFPERVLDYKKDIQVLAAKRWTTDMSLGQFKAITKLNGFPDYLKKDLANDTLLKVYSNGSITYKLLGVHAKVAVTWAYKAPEGAGDTHYSILRGTKANLVIRQGAEQQYKPALYVEPAVNNLAYEKALQDELKRLQVKYPGVELKKSAKGWEVLIPDSYREGHEAHFARVTQQFLEYLQKRNMPKWEVPNMLAKYYTTTKALEVASQSPSE
ncbi:putative oxidoreductase C-terminal domain-containing protein [Hymenobacter sp. GOD-10R]|uniref:putative oxidoreductase C-terminal domain-containing protein n=1 Tax=Hymenobacter sp. GOD-10R TaxID=3093922 RepID=UPI002D76B2C3|nr:putative oxidoreductase C-terminal domain-containing protein [Hymenobacter sp. GOD-10R]WRQ30869.1 putative oxidoreductase C-terminal domain-containing protein [Hymenobacter sp. GOD-10R]